jgi:hypothetical protein
MAVRVACAGAWKWAFLGLAAIVLLLGALALAGHAVPMASALGVRALVLRFAITVTYWGVVGHAARRRGRSASLAKSRCRSRRVKVHWNGVAVAS